MTMQSVARLKDVIMRGELQNLEGLSIGNNALKDEGIILVADLIKEGWMPHLRTFQINGVQCGVKGMMYLLDALGASKLEQVC